jgi:hypothetical protein
MERRTGLLHHEIMREWIIASHHELGCTWWTSRRSVDWEYEHCAGRQHDALFSQRRKNKTNFIHANAVLSHGPESCIAGHSLKMWHGLHALWITHLETLRFELARQMARKDVRTRWKRRILAERIKSVPHPTLLEIHRLHPPFYC